MLKKYKLVDAFQGGVDHLIDGSRVAVDENMTDEQAEVLIAAGVSYFEPIESNPTENDGELHDTHQAGENDEASKDDEGDANDAPAVATGRKSSRTSKTATTAGNTE